MNVTIAKALGRVGWWLQRPILKLQQETIGSLTCTDEEWAEFAEGTPRTDTPVSEPRTLDVSTETIKSWPKMRPSQWTDEQAEHVHGLVHDGAPASAHTPWQMDIRGTEPSWYKAAFLEQQRLERERRERLEQPHMGDELTPDEVEHFLEHRLEHKRLVRKLTMYTPAELQAMSLEQYRALFGGLPSTMPPDSPQEPVSAAEPEDEPRCAVCGEPVIGGKDDWWHVAPGGGYGEPRGPDGHLARLEQSFAYRVVKGLAGQPDVPPPPPPNHGRPHRRMQGSTPDIVRETSDFLRAHPLASADGVAAALYNAGLLRK